MVKILEIKKRVARKFKDYLEYEDLTEFEQNVYDLIPDDEYDRSYAWRPTPITLKDLRARYVENHKSVSEKKIGKTLDFLLKEAFIYEPRGGSYFAA